MQIGKTTPPYPSKVLGLFVLASTLAWPGLTEARAGGVPPEAPTAYGRVRGQELDGGPACVFRGMAFAAPPVGALRWRPPQPPAPWSGTRDALVSGPPAAQPALGWNDAMAAASREDCLYLDVWTPALAPREPLPVMVWFHGGANLAGSGGFDPAYDGRTLIRDGVLLVVAEYRLGVFGFLAHPDLDRESEHGSSGNYALLDQIAALRWVRDNISGFGGDPRNVTIFGQSAGATDVLALMATPLSEGLFSRAIAESGLPGRTEELGRDAAEEAGLAMARRLGAPTAGAAAFLRSLPAASLLKEGADIRRPAADGWVFPRSPLETWRSGAERAVPLVIGTNSVEVPSVGSPEEIRRMIEAELGPLAQRALPLYGLAPGAGPAPPDPVYGSAADQWGSDGWHSLDILHGEWLSEKGTPVWEYEFDRAIPPRAHASHSGELPYVFGNLGAKSGNLAGAYTDADRSLSRVVRSYWTNFAKTGNPNGAGLPVWPAYTAAGRSFMRFGPDGAPVAGADERAPFMALFRERARAGD